MRYKIDYSASDKYDRWGHTIACALPSVKYADSLADAEERARVLSCQFKKRDINVYDMEGYTLYGSSVWCVYSFRGGRRTMVNQDYFNPNKEQLYT